MRARLAVTLVALAAGAFLGCVSLKRTSEARFFALRSVAEAPPTPAGESDATIVGVLPVLVPGSLERPQLVRWSGPGEIQIDEFLRWTEPLDSGVQRVLVEDLETLLPFHRVVKTPWPAATPLRCRVRVEVFSFGPQPGGEVSLAGRFVLLPARGERSLAARGFDLKHDRASGPPDPGQAVEAMSALLADLAGQIAEAIAALPPDPSERVPSTAEGGACLLTNAHGPSRDLAPRLR
jgi:uncharacterized lipoprotein YmbA